MLLRMLVMINVKKLNKISIIAILFLSNSSFSYAMDEQSAKHYNLNYHRILGTGSPLHEVMEHTVHQVMQKKTNPIPQKLTMGIYELNKTSSKAYKQDDLEFKATVNGCMEKLFNEQEKENSNDAQTLKDIKKARAPIALGESQKVKGNKTLRPPMSKRQLPLKERQMGIGL